jgi:hypothetical protein
MENDIVLAATLAANRLRDHFGRPSPPWLDSVDTRNLNGEMIISVKLMRDATGGDAMKVPGTWEGFPVRMAECDMQKPIRLTTGKIIVLAIAVIFALGKVVTIVWDLVSRWLG